MKFINILIIQYVSHDRYIMYTLFSVTFLKYLLSSVLRNLGQTVHQTQAYQICTERGYWEACDIVLKRFACLHVVRHTTNIVCQSKPIIKHWRKIRINVSTARDPPITLSTAWRPQHISCMNNWRQQLNTERFKINFFKYVN